MQKALDTLADTGYSESVASGKNEKTNCNARTAALKIDAALHQRVAIAARLKQPRQTITEFVENALRLALGPRRAA